MSSLSPIIFLCWFIFVVYWAISAIGVKKDVSQRSGWRKFLLLRILLIIILIWLLNQGSFSHFWDSAYNLPLFSNAIVQIIGAILCGGGILFAFWARWNLGRNWSGTPQIKIDHELVTSGPYRFVRHPIYTGMLTALLGSALTAGPAWLIIFIVATIVFIMRIGKEEGYMMKLFPDQYPAYKKRTKALIPFVW